MYPEVVSECSGARVSECSVRILVEYIRKWCPSVGCTDLQARGVRVSRAGSLVNTGLDLKPHGTSLKAVFVTPSV